MRKLILISVLTICMVGVAQADLVAVGPAVLSNSWTQDFTVSDAWNFFGTDVTWFDNFDAMTIDMTQGSLEVPGMTNVSPSMSTTSNGPDLVTAFGNNVQNVNFTLNFMGSITAPVSFDLKVYDKSGRKYNESGWATAIWSSSSWSIVDNSAFLNQNGNPVDLNPVPVPGAVLLGILGLSAAGMKLRKFA